MSLVPRALAPGPPWLSAKSGPAGPAVGAVPCCVLLTVAEAAEAGLAAPGLRTPQFASWLPHGALPGTAPLVSRCLLLAEGADLGTLWWPGGAGRLTGRQPCISRSPAFSLSVHLFYIPSRAFAGRFSQQYQKQCLV